MIKQLLNKSIQALMILLIIFFMGMFFPMLIITIDVMLTDNTYELILSNSVIFWIAVIVGWIISMLWINDVMKEIDLDPNL